MKPGLALLRSSRLCCTLPCISKRLLPCSVREFDKRCFPNSCRDVPGAASPGLHWNGATLQSRAVRLNPHLLEMSTDDVSHRSRPLESCAPVSPHPGKGVSDAVPSLGEVNVALSSSECSPRAARVVSSHSLCAAQQSAPVAFQPRRAPESRA